MANKPQLTRRNKSNPEIPTSSMADIAFLLIVFFLVTTTMNQDKGIGMQLPPAGENKKIQKKNICNVWVNSAGDILINLEQEVPLGQLRADIERRLSENDKLIVSLKADEETAYNDFIDVLDEIKLSGATRISLASPEK
ncbi:MAG: biopolymer transporter ExbD [Candidatus Latescibacteria bacterium]|nr:biopolymer transporter ExbD [Candidatus Latescibacterota bacterium]